MFLSREQGLDITTLDRHAVLGRGLRGGLRASIMRPLQGQPQYVARLSTWGRRWGEMSRTHGAGAPGASDPGGPLLEPSSRGGL